MSENKTGKYLKYAIGEIVLIILGVLIALSASNWNINRLSTQREVKSLQEINNRLKSDYIALKSFINITELGFKSIVKLDSLLRQEIPVYTNSMDSLFGAVYGFRVFSYEKANYEDLKVNNLNLIKNDSLRQKLILVYESLYDSIEKNYNTEIWVNDELRPYYLKNFRNLNFRFSATPLNYEMIWEDEYYRNLVNYRLTFLRDVSIPSFYKLKSEFEKLIQLIDEYLNY